jgi:hypothetical protein
LSYVEGDLAKNPSFWVRDVRIARRYRNIGGVTLPIDVRSTARVRMFGAGEMHMTITYLSIDGVPVDRDRQDSPSAATSARPALPLSIPGR